MKKITLFLVFLYALVVYSQVDVGNNLVVGTVDTSRAVQNIVFKSRIKVPVNAIVFNLGYNIPMLDNKLMRSDFWNKKIGTGIDFSVDFRYQFQKRAIEDESIVSAPTYFGIGVGLGCSVLLKAIECEKYNETLPNYMDVDGDNCEVVLDFQKLQEKFRLAYLDLPVYIEIGRPSRIKTSAFLKLGAKASLLVYKKLIYYDDKYPGRYTSQGNYEQWGLTLPDVDVLGYYTDVSCYVNPETGAAPECKMSPFVVWGSVAMGINFPFSSFEKNKIAKCILRISAKADYSLTPISKALQESYFKDSAFRLYQINMFGGKGTRIFSAGLVVSLIYCLK
jgi:hypothetical protein